MLNRRINPNRMELLRLRRQLDVSRRGHKLLKDKLDELIRVFMVKYAENQSLRAQVESNLASGYQLYTAARALAGDAALNQALLSGGPTEAVSVSTARIVGVSVPEMNVPEGTQRRTYSLVSTPSVLDAALERVGDVLPQLVELSAHEKAIELLAAEIESTRRRVNALEYVLIPQQERDIKLILSKLDENERSERIRLMKVKEMLESSGETGL